MVTAPVVSFSENSPHGTPITEVVRRTGLALPETTEPGPTEVGPVRPTIIWA
ncbi:hypothetical protein BvCmsSINP011_02840 [Escherichia coli]|nr:hypothetical protein BvCmsHHP001_00590 [Escherichia coli]GDR79655.1 hypothetical protein BvCmsSINP011_02840 [Escherichia coli]